MKRFLIILSITVSSLAGKSQRTNEVKSHRPKIKNGNVLIVPDQKPVVIERRDDLPVIAKKQGPVTIKNNLPPGKAKKLYGAKSARAFAPGQQKKPISRNKNKRFSKEK